MIALSQRRKADREAMAKAMTALAAEFGAETTRVDRERSIYMRITMPGAFVAMGFDADAEGPRGWGYLGHWVCDRGRMFRSGVLGRPHHKKTTIAGGFTTFSELIRAGLEDVADGSAFHSESSS
jgi:hypothetical protein